MEKLNLRSPCTHLDMGCLPEHRRLMPSVSGEDAGREAVCRLDSSARKGGIPGWANAVEPGVDDDHPY
jgi:hypothetical protein